MKKIISVVLAAVLCAALCVAANAVKDPNTWLCQVGGPYTTGWWISPEDDESITDWKIDVVFTTPHAFCGFVMVCYAGADPDPGAAEVKISLIDAKGRALEYKEKTITGNHTNDAEGYIQVYFENAYAAGTYTIRFELTGGAYFVLGSAPAGALKDVHVSDEGCLTTKLTNTAPSMALYGAEPPAQETEPEDTEPEATETEPEETEPDETEPDATEPEETESDETEPDATEPVETEPDLTEPDETEPDATEPDETEPDETEPDETEPDATEPDETEPDATEPDETETDATEPDETEPDETEPDETEPDETEPEETEEPASEVEAKDINGDGEKDNKDVVVLFRYVSGVDREEDETKYDVNGDNEVNNKDVVALFRALSKLESSEKPEGEASPAESADDGTEDGKAEDSDVLYEAGEDNAD